MRDIFFDNPCLNEGEQFNLDTTQYLYNLDVRGVTLKKVQRTKKNIMKLKPCLHQFLKQISFDITELDKYADMQFYLVMFPSLSAKVEFQLCIRTSSFVKP